MFVRKNDLKDLGGEFSSVCDVETFVCMNCKSETLLVLFVY